MTMSAPAAGTASAASVVRGLPDATSHDCSPEMLGAECGLMTGCATASALPANSAMAGVCAQSARVIAGDLTSIPLAAARPEPPPPRA